MESREVIVIGAGPAGATTATALAQMGRDVLLLDRQSFPRDKACGDGVPADALNLLCNLGMAADIEAAIAAGNWYRVDGMRLVSPGGYVVNANFSPNRKGTSSYVVPRFHFDALIQNCAVAAGAEFRQGRVTAPLVEQGRVAGVTVDSNGTQKKIRAKLVIGADGVTSILTRKLLLPTHRPQHKAVGLRAYINDIQEYPRQVEFYLLKSVLPGYVWIFPLGRNRANIGLGIRLDLFRQKTPPGSLKKMLLDFLNLPSMKNRLQETSQISNIATWQLNFGSQKKLRYSVDGAMLVGDAAGFINPLTGGGIHNALLSACLAAEVAHDAFTKNNFSAQTLRAYQQRCYDAMWANMRYAYWLQQALNHFPIMADWLIRRMRTNSILAQAFMKKL